MMTTKTSMFDRPVEVPDGLVQRARERGWPDGLVERACALRTPRADIEWWLTHDQSTPDNIARFLDWRERVMSGTLRVREATWSDAEALADLYANSPEQIGEWEVTVERSPYPYAQFRLQEHVNIQVVEDRGIILAAAAHSGRNTIVGGRRLTAHVASAWRTRKECRGQGYSNLMRVIGGPGCAWFGVVNYWYVRSGNAGAVGWIKALRPDLAEKFPKDEEGKMPGQPVTVHHFRARPLEGNPSTGLRAGASGIRPARRSDTRRCVSLINRTHRGLDLFRPYSVDFLTERLDDPSWGPKPEFWEAVYGWEDYFVLEEAGRIVACAGLWDRARHVRETWRHQSTGEQRTIETTALMDFGYAPDREDAMARLIGYLIGRTDELGRHVLMAPIERLPALLEPMQAYEPSEETRTLAADNYQDGKIQVEVKIRRPYTDLAYW